MRPLIVAAIGVFIGALIGVRHQRAMDLVLRAMAGAVPWRDSAMRLYAGRQMVDVSGREVVTCPPASETILILGQSNAANSVGERFRSRLGAVDWLDGRCYVAAGPTLGSEGELGSIWPLVGDLLMAARPGQPVRFVGLAFGGSSSREWADARSIGGLLARRLAELKVHGVVVTHVAWHQGEADWNMPVQDYLANLRRVIAQVHTAYPDAVFFVAQTSICIARAPREELLAAQASLVDGIRVRAGPNTDLIADFEDRYDGCHFSGTGARKAADAWAKSFLVPISPSPPADAARRTGR